MRRIIKITIILLSSTLLLSSCIKETFPLSSTVTADQARESLEAQVYGLHAWMNKFDVLNRDVFHWDFGYPALMMMRDFMGQDIIMNMTYANWEPWISIVDLGPDLVTTQMPWRWYYSLLYMANNVIGDVPDYTQAQMTERHYVGMAYVWRAMAYFDMARLYLQGNYRDNPDGKTIPIVLKETEETTDVYNNPRAKASDVYQVILSDLTKALDCLRDYTAYETIMPNLEVVHGFFARVYLEMGNWAKAEEHAILAKDGWAPLTESQWRDKKNGFNTPDNNNSWMWCCTTDKNDRVVTSGIVNWASNMASETLYGYAGPAATNYIMIDAHLFSLIPDTDFRKNSWRYGNNMDSDFPYRGYLPQYATFKFRPGSGDYNSYLVGSAASVPLMRVEEMILIEAEAKGHQNLAAGKTALENFVKTYRDPAFVSTATTLDQFIEEVWLQRRIELWGEGFATFDIKRLNKPVIRKYAGTNHAPGGQFNTEAMPSWMNFVISRSETLYNVAIPQSDNNPTPIPPDEPANNHEW